MSCTGTTRERAKLKGSAVPSAFAWTLPASFATVARCERASKRSAQVSSTVTTASNTKRARKELQDTDIPYICEETVTAVNEDATVIIEQSSINSKEVQTHISNVNDSKSCGTQFASNAVYSAVKFKYDNRSIHFYTGLETYVKFIFVLSTLGPAAYHLNYKYGSVTLSIVDQFLLTLIKLRRHLCNFELSRMFGVSEVQVYNVVFTWIRFMALQWREISIWPPQEVVRFYAPTDCKAKFPSTRVMIDGTECPIRKPALPSAQQSTFSTYKNRNTVKTLIGATPSGLISYISPAYGGSTSDRQIVERSSLPQICSAGDSIMADKGFNVQDIFDPCKVSVNIPTFFSKKTRMTNTVVQKDRKISSKRVHIERIIALGKTFKILCNPMNAVETLLASDIIFICFMLCNFRKGIISKDA